MYPAQDKMLSELTTRSQDYISEDIILRLTSWVHQTYPHQLGRYRIDCKEIECRVAHLKCTETQIAEMFPTETQLKVAYTFSNQTSIYRACTLRMILQKYLFDQTREIFEECKVEAVIYISDEEISRLRKESLLLS